MKKKTQKLMETLRKQYPHPTCAFLTEVRVSTGYALESRVDALAMHLWPSKGLELVGFEVKTSRADWLKEVKQPEKCEPFKQFCDRWYLVTDDQSIVKRGYGITGHDDELPDDWGWMYIIPHTKHSNPIFKVEKEAPKLEPKPVDRYLLASILRIASNPFDEVTINGRSYTTTNN